LRFARSRIKPDKTALAELETWQRVMPVLRTIPWYGLRHSTRILRWVFTRPPRVQTFASVRAALDGGTQTAPAAKSRS
jgi:hypothetical protein